MTVVVGPISCAERFQTFPKRPNESIFFFFFFTLSRPKVCELLLSFEIINYQLTGPFCVRLCLFGDNQVKQKWRGGLKHPKLNQNQSWNPQKMLENLIFYLADDGEWSAELFADVVVSPSWFCGEIFPAKIFNELSISIFSQFFFSIRWRRDQIGLKA
jgi:hypothetical protein